MNSGTANLHGHPDLLRCDDARDLPSFMRHVVSVIVSGQPFAWWVEDADRSIRLGFVIRIERGASRVADPSGADRGVYSDFAAAVQFGARLDPMPSQEGQGSPSSI